jgi:hypothetical protein
VNKQRGSRRQRSPSPTRRENNSLLTYNQEGLRDRNFQRITGFGNVILEVCKSSLEVEI